MAYLMVLILSAAGVAALDARFRLAFWHAPRSTALAVAAGTAFFLLWDVAAIASGIFLHRESPHMTGIMLGPELPLEEPMFLAFFSYTAVALFAGARRMLGSRAPRPVPAELAGGETP
jgi:lycopene cyclase domain-containing protein